MSTLPPGPWELVAFNTDSRYSEDVRYRSYTSSEPKARAFEQIDKVQFSDSGHGIVFHARTATRPRKPTVSWEHVDQQLAVQKASWHVKRYIAERERSHAMTVEHMQERIDKITADRDYQADLVKQKQELLFDLQRKLGSAQRALEAE